MRSLPLFSYDMRSPFPISAVSSVVGKRRRAILQRGAMLGGTAAVLAACSGEPSGVPRHVIIPPGTTLRAAAESLARHDVIDAPRLFRIYADFERHDRDLKPGTYLLQRHLGWQAALDALTRGKGLVHTVTIPEGWELREIGPLLQRVLNVPAESINAAVRDSALLERVGAPGPTLEGYLFPDTYTFPDGFSARAAVAEMVREFEREWRPHWDSLARSFGMSRQDVVTLASIIEKEARRPDERPLISAVYHNRLRRHMPLQADPTVQFALGHHVERVTFKDLEIASPYNTYRHLGLPPGPIGSPGVASLDAAVIPAAVPFLYFVAAPDGHHEFRSTFAEHSAARHAIRRQTHRPNQVAP
jgi:UPF0755 protein